MLGMFGVKKRPNMPSKTGPGAAYDKAFLEKVHHQKHNEKLGKVQSLVILGQLTNAQHMKNHQGSSI